ncbi:hypothetical protein ACFFR3_44505 [Nonomuraea salmonea]|uniref:Uncharacterized protein n=1 Tax=Nonomuraea salmonea TaxID=46181 RepID=A0ABV5P260_9ACTN
MLQLPSLHHFGPHRELIDTIGVPADHQAPTSPADLATGLDRPWPKRSLCCHKATPDARAKAFTETATKQPLVDKEVDRRRPTPWWVVLLSGQVVLSEERLDQ